MNRDEKRKEYRLGQIKTFAEYINSVYSTQLLIDLNEIAKTEGVPIYYDHYENYFDGVLTYDENTLFHIHLNIDKGNTVDSLRSRFSLAHEFGHFFIEEHRLAIIDGTLIPHTTEFNPKNNNVIEQEADYFAACLLMPSYKFKTACNNEKFSLNLIERLSTELQTSRLSTLLRFLDKDSGTYPIMIFCFKNGNLSWALPSNDFRFKDVAYKTKKGLPPPKTSVIGSYYLNSVDKYTSVEEVSSNDWFWGNHDIKMYEQCFYSNAYDYDLSIVWFD